MLNVKKLLSEIVNWAGFKFTWDANTNNTTDTWVPVFNLNKIQHRIIPRDILTIRTVNATINRAFSGNVSITAPQLTGYKFVAWVAVETSGWVGSCYVSGSGNENAKIWNASTGQSGNGTVYATALYKAIF